VISLGDRKYRVRGLAKNLSYEPLRVNIPCAQGDAIHVDMLELWGLPDAPVSHPHWVQEQGCGRGAGEWRSWGPNSIGRLTVFEVAARREEGGGWRTFGALFRRLEDSARDVHHHWGRLV